MAAILALLLASASPGRPLGDPGEWITSDDYPKAELARGVNGTTAFVLSVDRAGAVTGCKVVKSSGSDELDMTTCSLLRTRAHFVPGRDRQGRPTAFTYSSRVKWMVPIDKPTTMPSRPETVTIVVDINKQGVIESCSIVARSMDPPGSDGTECSPFPVGRQMQVMSGADGKPINMRLTITRTVTFSTRN